MSIVLFVFGIDWRIMMDNGINNYITEKLRGYILIARCLYNFVKCKSCS